MRIALVTPAGPGTRNGNRHTALRWAAFLRAAGHTVSLSVEWPGDRADLMLALHARRSHSSIKAFPGVRVVALTGTDVYRDIRTSAEAWQSLELADRLIVLQEEALAELDRPVRRKARVVYQSADPRARRAPPARVFRVAVIGHLREEKDPFRAVAALARLPQDAAIEVVHVGAALQDGMAPEARRRMREEPRYRWLGGLPHARALAWLARSHLLVVSSRMEGGANVIAEAARLGTPVLASSIPGNIGMLGRGYPGYFPLGDERSLARLMARAEREPEFYRRLRRALAARRPRFAPAAERAALVHALRDLMRPSGRGSGAARR